MEPLRDILTPEQAARYLQVDRETIYRYIRQGKLVASRLGRAYRIPKTSLDRLLFTSRTRQVITLREYTGAEVADFVQADRLGKAEQAVIARWEAQHPDQPSV